MAINVNDKPTITATFKSGGVLTDPDTVTATVLAPDGTVTNPTVISSGTGVYYIELLLTQARRWQVKFLGVGTVFAAEHAYIQVVETPLD